MKKFMVLGYATLEAYEYMKTVTDEQRKQMLDDWFRWKEEVGDQLQDMGSPLMQGTVISPKGNRVPVSGNLAGYMMIQADDMDAAIALLESSPLYDSGPGNTYEIYECLDMKKQ